MRSIGLPVCCSIKSGQYLTGPIDHRHYLVYKMWLVKKKYTYIEIYVHCNYTIYIIELKRIRYSRFYQLFATGPNLFFLYYFRILNVQFSDCLKFAICVGQTNITFSRHYRYMYFFAVNTERQIKKKYSQNQKSLDLLLSQSSSC